MTSSHKRYVAIEAGVGALTGGLFGVGFFLLFFGRFALVPVHGHGLITDSVPQTFMTATCPLVHLSYSRRSTGHCLGR